MPSSDCWLYPSHYHRSKCVLLHKINQQTLSKVSNLVPRPPQDFITEPSPLYTMN